MTLYQNFSFQVLKTSNNGGRLGKLQTPHGIVETPAFIFCATKAAIKGATPQDMWDANTQIILSNTYHLMLQPGADTVEKLGGLHKMMGWNGPMLTDSGGFQIFSLGHGSVSNEIKGKRTNHRPSSVLKISEDGARFKSYLDGREILLTPELSMDIQRKLGPDLAVMFDECTPFHVDKSYTQRSMNLSHRWGLRSLNHFKRHDNGAQALYGIVQGGVYPDLRKESATFVNENEFFAHAVGGSLGASQEQMYEVVGMAMSHLSKDRPVHLLGIGGVRDIFVGASLGIDTFDCVHPTRLARHGGALIRATGDEIERQGYRLPQGREHINLRNAVYAQDNRPIDDTCGCKTCQNFSRGYLNHLLRAGELLGMQAITIHNIYFMNRLLKAVRQAISEDRLMAEEKNWRM